MNHSTAGAKLYDVFLPSNDPSAISAARVFDRELEIMIRDCPGLRLAASLARFATCVAIRDGARDTSAVLARAQLVLCEVDELDEFFCDDYFVAHAYDRAQLTYEAEDVLRDLERAFF